MAGFCFQSHIHCTPVVVLHIIHLWFAEENQVKLKSAFLNIFDKLIAFEIIATLDMYKINWQKTGKESKQSVLTRRVKRWGGVLIWC
jgi:hypothetical protein